MGPTDIRPLFIFSLPRTGSTWLQRMLGDHSGVATANETWLLLPLLYSLRPGGVYAEYGHRAAVAGITDLGRALPGGLDDYRQEIRRFALSVYRRASGPEAVYYLDKTPRYHVLADEIISLFDEGRFVFLWRHPLAVVASMLDMGSGPRWWPHPLKLDLFAGLESLVDAIRRHADRCLAVRYEDLVDDPARELSRLFAYLDLPTEDVTPAADVKPLGKWHRVLTTPLRKRWCRRYLGWIGKERLAVMGYDLDRLVAELEEIPIEARFASDVYYSVKAAAWSVAEPAILADKKAIAPDWRRFYSHW